MLAWIEYINRLLGVMLGLLILVVAVLAVLNFRGNAKILILSLFSLLLVGFQGWLGSVVVASELEPLIVSLHMLVALIIVSILIYLWQYSSYFLKVYKPLRPPLPARPAQLLKILWIAAVAQILFGTQVREKIENLVVKFPLSSDAAIIHMLGAINYLHIIFGIFVAALSMYLAYNILHKFDTGHPLLKQSSVMMVFLILTRGSLEVTRLIQTQTGMGIMMERRSRMDIIR